MGWDEMMFASAIVSFSFGSIPVFIVNVAALWMAGWLVEGDRSATTATHSYSLLFEISRSGTGGGIGDR